MTSTAQRITDAERLEHIHKLKGITEKEALEILAYDKAVEAGKPTPYDLTPEQAKVSRQMCRTGTRTTKPKLSQGGALNLPKRERKTNPTKESIIAEIAKFLEEKSENAVENLEITNKERQIKFTIGTETYELTLVQKRKPKN